MDITIRGRNGVWKKSQRPEGKGEKTRMGQRNRDKEAKQWDPKRDSITRARLKGKAQLRVSGQTSDIACRHHSGRMERW